MSGFFTAPASQRKRKRPDTGATTSSKRRTISSTGKSAPPKKARQIRDESISASDSDDSGEDARARGDYEEEEDNESSGAEDETADERRLRLAQRYLDNIREEVEGDPYAFDAADVDRDLIAERLKEDVAETKGKLHKHIAGDFDYLGAAKTFFTADQNGVTAVATALPYAFTVSGDGSIAMWELAEPTSLHSGDTKKEPINISPRKRPKLVKRFRQPRQPKASYQGHTSSILCIAVSSSGKFLATGGSDKKLVIWDAQTLKPLKCFTHHRDSVLSVSFRRGAHTLYSASADRTCKVWSLDEMGYVQTLFGHQDEVVDIAGLAAEKFISVGARDRTARLFKVIEEQQLVFRGGGGGGPTKEKKREVNGISGDAAKETTRYEEGSIDRVAAIDEETFVTGSDNGSISLWSVLRKKPVFTIPLAHGADERLSLEEAYAEEDVDAALKDKERPGREMPRWITALTTIPLADIVLSGSWDGYVRVWRVTPDRKRLEAMGVIGSSGQLSHGAAQDTGNDDTQTNGYPNADARDGARLIGGIINDLSITERNEKSKVGTSSQASGLCVVAAVSKSHRFGKWHIQKGVKGVKNGAVVFEVLSKASANGISVEEDEEQDDDEE